MDSDGDYIDDLTESYLNDPDYPYPRSLFPTYLFSITPVIFIGLAIPVLMIKRKKGKIKQIKLVEQS